MMNSDDSDVTTAEGECEDGSPSVLSNMGGSISAAVQTSCSATESMQKQDKDIEAVARNQCDVMQAISGVSQSSTEDLYKQAAAIESDLKHISLVNQESRKALASAFSALSQTQDQQEDMEERKKNLKDELTSLSCKQKKLLECFMKQKSIVSKLNQLRQTRESAGNVTQASGRTHKRLLQSYMPTATKSGPEPSASVATTVTSTAVCTQSTSASGTGTQPNSHQLDLAQPVPLASLMKHHLIKPQKDCFTCMLMGCEFKASLASDGALQSSESGRAFQSPHQWLASCWEALGHTKKISKKHAYRMVQYVGTPLIQFCEQYSLKQVSTYLSQKQSNPTMRGEGGGEEGGGRGEGRGEGEEGRKGDRVVAHHPQQYLSEQQHSSNQSSTQGISDGSAGGVNAGLPGPDLVGGTGVVSMKRVLGLDELLKFGEVLLVTTSRQTSLDLPRNFWSEDYTISTTGHLYDSIEQDFEW